MKKLIAIAMFLVQINSVAFGVPSRPPGTNPPGIGDPTPKPCGFGPCRPPPTSQITQPPAQPITFIPGTGIGVRYTKISDKLSEFYLEYNTQTDLNPAFIDPKLLTAVQKLQEGFISAAVQEQLDYDYSHNYVIIETADDYRVLAELQATRNFLGDVLWLTKIIGFSAIGSGLAILSKELQQTQGFPPARAAYIASAIGAAVTMASSAALDQAISNYDNEITAVREQLDQREKYLFSEFDQGTNPYTPPSCIYKTSCIDRPICTTNGLSGPKICANTTTCFDELLSCRSRN